MSNVSKILILIEPVTVMFLKHWFLKIWGLIFDNKATKTKQRHGTLPKLLKPLSLKIKAEHINFGLVRSAVQCVIKMHSFINITTRFGDTSSAVCWKINCFLFRISKIHLRRFLWFYYTWANLKTLWLNIECSQ